MKHIKCSENVVIVGIGGEEAAPFQGDFCPKIFTKSGAGQKFLRKMFFENFFGHVSDNFKTFFENFFSKNFFDPKNFLKKISRPKIFPQKNFPQNFLKKFFEKKFFTIG